MQTAYIFPQGSLFILFDIEDRSALPTVGLKMDGYCRICMRNDLNDLVSLFCERNGEVIANMIIDCADVMVSPRPLSGFYLS